MRPSRSQESSGAPEMRGDVGFRLTNLGGCGHVSRRTAPHRSPLADIVGEAPRQTPQKPRDLAFQHAGLVEESDHRL